MPATLPTEQVITSDPIRNPAVRVESFSKPPDKPAEKPAKAKTAEEIQSEVDEVLKGMGWPVNPKQKTDESKPDSTPAAPTPTPTAVVPDEQKAPEGTPVSADATKPDATPAEPKPDEPKSGEPVKPAEEKPRRKKTAGLDAEAIRVLARDAAQEALRQPEKPTPAPSAPTGEELDPEQVRMVGVLQEMERLNPGKYSGIVAKTIKGWKSFEEYQRKWEASNPGEEFDPEAEEHAQVEAKLMPEYSESEFEDAKDAIRERKIEERLRKENEKKEAAKNIEAKTQQSLRQAEAELVAQTDPELAKVYQADPTKLPEADAIAAEEILESRNKLAPLIKELDKLTDPHLGYKPKEGNRDFEFLNSFAVRCEQNIKSLPVEQQFNDAGQRFVTSDEFSKLPPERQGNVWTFTPDMLRYALTTHFARGTKEKIEKRKSQAIALAEKLGYKKPETAAKVTPNPVTPEPAKPAAPAAKPNPPSLTSTTDTIKTLPGTTDGGNDLAKLVATRMWDSD